MQYEFQCRYCSKRYTAWKKTQILCGSKPCHTLYVKDNNVRQRQLRAERTSGIPRRLYTFDGAGNLVDQLGQLHPRSAFEERLWSKVDRRIGECWLWQGALNNRGYGQFKVAGETFLAHRIAYGLTHGTVPRELFIDHLCRNRSCINPTHLEPVTNQENLARGWPLIMARRAARTHCINGHPWTPENTRMMGNNLVCKTCRSESNAKYVEKKGAERIAAGLTKTSWKPPTPKVIAYRRNWKRAKAAAKKAEKTNAGIS